MANNAGSGGSAGAGRGGAAGVAGRPGRHDCLVDNGGCGDPRFWHCIPDRTPPCADIDECAISNGGCAFRTSCFNQPGGPPRCGNCPAGFTGDSSAGCSDINECLTNNGGCGERAYGSCFNTIGGAACTDVDACLEDNGGCGDPAEELCMDRYLLPPLCEPDECFTNGSNGGCGDIDQFRCHDRPGEPLRCWSKIVSVAVTEWGGCFLREDRRIDCWEGNVEIEDAFIGTTYVRLSPRGNHPCAVTEAGSISCLSNTHVAGRPTSSDFEDVATGQDHACGLRTDGTVFCWGHDDQGSVTGPNAESGIRQVATGNHSTCVVRDDGTLRCWGPDFRGEIAAVNAFPASDFTAVFPGYDNICALREGGTAVCWGSNEHGQLTQVGAPDGAAGFTNLSVGTDVVCGVRVDSWGICWGLDNANQTSPVNSAGAGVVSVRSGPSRNCLLFSDGTVGCYGAGEYGQNGDPWVR